MWKSEGDNDRREAASAVRQGVLRGKRRLAAVAVGASLGIAAIVAVYMAWRGGGAHDGEGAPLLRPHARLASLGGYIATRQPPPAVVHDGEGAVATRQPPPAVVHDGGSGVATGHGPPVATNAAKRLYRGVEVVSSSCSTNLDGAVVERLRLADGSFVKAVRLPEPAFRRPTDQIIAMAVSAEPGTAVPPLPIGPDAERGFLDSLSEPIPDLDSDTTKMRRLKARVREARAQIAEAMRGGSSFREAMEAHVRESARMADARAEAARMAQEVRREGGEAEARAFTERANAMLEADGVPPIPVPGKGRGEL